MKKQSLFFFLVCLAFCRIQNVRAEEISALKGKITDTNANAIPNAKVTLLSSDEKLVQTVFSQVTGQYEFGAVPFGAYRIDVEADAFNPLHSEIELSAVDSSLDFNLTPLVNNTEMVMHVQMSRKKSHLETGSSEQLGKTEVSELPQGDQVELPKLLSSTLPGIVPGPLGQMFFRGNYENNIQYRLDGIPLPDSPGSQFGQVFPPRNIERLDVILGGLPAEYGQRVGGAIDIVTKSGSNQSGASGEVSYGSYQTFSPTASLGGTAEDLGAQYFLSGSYCTTERALGTPQPVSPTNAMQGGTNAIHDYGTSHHELLKIDWIAGNEDKLTLLTFNTGSYFQIPNYPSSFSPSDPLFSQPDSYGNPPLIYRPAGTNDTQSEQTFYTQLSWRHTFNDRVYLQIAPYWKQSNINVANDLQNDLAGVGPGQTYASFAENRTVNDFGLYSSLVWQTAATHRIKTGIQIQSAAATGILHLTTATDTPTNTQSFTDSAPNSGVFQALFIQDEFSPLKELSFNLGLRFNATQNHLASGTDFSDYSFQPRLGVSYSITEWTRVHAFYGKLYQPAPVEDLRAAFNAVTGSGLNGYDVKSELADYYELGLEQSLPLKQTFSVTAYYKYATNWLDDAQLLNTFLTQPINYHDGYALGADVSLHGDLSEDFTDFINYSYSVVRVRGLSGGIFTQETPPTGYIFLDTSQYHTINTGLIYHHAGAWSSVRALYGSGLPTGENGTEFLPGHLTFDVSLGYEFQNKTGWTSGLKISADLLNILNNVYPITIANGLTGSQYASGREFFVRLAKDL